MCGCASWTNDPRPQLTLSHALDVPVAGLPATGTIGGHEHDCVLGHEAPEGLLRGFVRCCP
jgi:hypothetical protein